MSQRSSFMSGTVISEVDTVGPTFNYYGFVRVDGGWVIQRESTTDPATHRYAMGKSDFSTAWGNRTGLVYEDVQTIAARLPFGSW